MGGVDEVTQPTVSAPAGTICGWQSDSVNHWGGIRYARAERFAPPSPMPPMERINATVPSAACPQVTYPDPMLLLPGALTGLGVDEACQQLSVHAPADIASGETLPVVVYIHGGAYVNGAGDSPYYDPTIFVREQRVIWVAVTYRLGVLGYLPSSAGPGNLGLLDQVAALRWVHDNIEAFGGDPEKVTILGQSAGGDAVAHLMISEGARGLFRRVISQSPPLGIATGRSDLFDAMGRRLDASGRATGPVDHLVSIQERVGQVSAARRSWRHMGMPYTVQYGSHPLPVEEDLDAAWAQVAPEIDVFMGTNVRETAFYLPKQVAAAGGRVGVVNRGIETIVRNTSDKIFHASVDSFMERHWRSGGRGFRYMVDWGPPTQYYGAHVIEMPLLFGSDAWRSSRLLDGLDWADVERLGVELRSVWGEFIHTGSAPSGPDFLDVRHATHALRA